MIDEVLSRPEGLCMRRIPWPAFEHLTAMMPFLPTTVPEAICIPWREVTVKAKNSMLSKRWSVKIHGVPELELSYHYEAIDALRAIAGSAALQETHEAAKE